MTLKTNYSPPIAMHFELHGRRYEIAKLGPGYFVPRESLELEPCVGVISLSVDGKEDRWQVRVPSRVKLTDRTVSISKL